MPAMTRQSHPNNNRLALLLLMLAILPCGQAADMVYVTDELSINLRAGTSTEHKILQMLPSGEPLEIVSDNAGNGYIKVRSQEGREGYVLKRLVSEQPSARERLIKAEKELELLRTDPDQLAGELEKLRSEHTSLRSELAVVSRQRNELEQRLENVRQTLAEPEKIANERDQLRQQVARYIRENEELKQDKLELENSSSQTWFILGGAAILLGIALGLLLPNLYRPPRRKQNWNTL